MNVFDRGTRRLVRLAAATTILGSMLYVVWRAVFTLAPESLAMGLFVLTLEAHAAIRFAMTIYELWSANDAPPPPRPCAVAHRVAVVVPTYDEGIEVLLPTVAAAAELEPAHETWILDDGARPEVEALAASLGVGYIARPDNSHAKAGNINHALEHLDADLVAVLDADHVAEPDFLIALMPYFDDPEMALVQSPQDFFNSDSFVHLEPGFHEEQFFHRAIQSGKNPRGAAFWCGTGSMVRVEALRSIGGVATASITEDLHTTIRLHRAGWKTVHHNAVLSRGLAARSFSEFSKQRWRWGAGAMQAFAIDFPLTARGLTTGQRMSYFASFLSWFDSWRTLGFLLVPLLVVATGWVPINIALGPLLAAPLLVLLCQLLSVRLLSGGHLRLWHATVFDILRLPTNLSATLVFFRPRSLRFGVTPKGGARSGSRPDRVPRILRTLEVAHVVAWLYGIASLAGVVGSPVASKTVLVTALGWILVNLFVLTSAITRITDEKFRPDKRDSVRIRGHARGRLGPYECDVHDLSTGGARIVLPGDFRVGLGSRLTLDLDIGRRCLLVCEVRRAYELTNGQVEIGVMFTAGQAAQLGQLAVALIRQRDQLPTLSPARERSTGLV